MTEGVFRRENEASQRTGIIRFILVGLLFLCRCTGLPQGTFVNMDFESPNTPLMPVGGTISATDGVPGWTVYANGIPRSVMTYNYLPVGSPLVSLQGPGSSSPIIQGSYSVVLAGWSGSFGTYGSAAVGQTGQIPFGAQSLVFWGNGNVGLDQVTFKGQILPLTITDTTPSYNIYSADVSSFAGQTGELLFTCPPVLPNYWPVIDNIQFSIPEPSTFALFGFAGLFLCLGRRRFRN